MAHSPNTKGSLDMKKRDLFDLFRTPLVIVAMAAISGGGDPMIGPPVQAQENDDDKVIQKTTDKDGFEKQLTQVDLMHQTAAQLMSAEQWDAAAAELNKVVAAQPDRIDGWSDLAKCYNNLKQYDNAANAYSSAVLIRPDDLDLLSNLGFAQLNAGLMDGAIETYNKMLEVDPISYDANVHLGFVYQKADDPEKAIAYYQKALEGKPDDVTTIGSLARLYAQAGDMENSVAMYNQAIEASTDEAQKNQFRSKLGKSMIAAKQWADAAVVYGALVESNPDNPANQFNLGISLTQSKQHAAAIPHLEKVIELSPDYIPAYQQLAGAYNEVGRFDDAIRTVQTALPLTDEKGGLYCTWGRSLEKQQLHDEAIDIFYKAVDDPQWGNYAKKQITRQENLKKRAAALKEQEG
jgi:tetratricopeptide (TPR) repeat protein